MLFKIVTDTELVNSEPLFLGKVQDQAFGYDIFTSGDT
jgi:hypothetical protein